MYRRFVAHTAALIALALLLSPACGGKKKSAQDPKLAKAGKPLEGKWREVKEFGGSKRKPADMPIMVLGKTSYKKIPPKKLGSPTMKGTWRVKEAKGKTLIIGLTLDLGGKPFKADDQRVKIIDANTLEWRNAKNGHGGIYKRVK